MDPPRADIRLGYLCNNNCRFCCVAEQRMTNIPTAQVKQDLELARKNGAEKIVFTGGEPTIRKDILNLVAYAKKIGFSDILIITNGRMCSYPEFMDKLVANGLTSLCFSLPDVRKDVYEHLTQVKGSHAHLMKAMENASRHNLQISTITVITKLNYKQLPGITKLLIKLKDKYPRFFSELMFINPTDNAWTYREELVPRISKVAPYVHKSLEMAKENRLVLNVEAIPMCYMQGYEDRVVELHMAKQRVFVDPDKGADYEYNKNRRVKGKVKNEECDNCKYNSICEGVWQKYARIHGTDELKAVKKSAENKVKSKLLQMTTACNQKCIFCTMDKYLKKEIPNFDSKPLLNEETNEYGMPLEEAKQKINESQCEELTFVGGEPTLRKNLAELISFAKSQGVRKIVLNTNGARLADMDYIRKLKEAGLDLVLVSLHGHTKEISEKVSQIEGNFEKTVKGIENSLNLGLEVNVVHVIYSGNYKQLKDFVRFMKMKFPKINCINFVFLKPNDENTEKVREMVPRLKDVEDYLNDAMEFCIENKLKFTVANVPLCFMKDFEDNNCQTNELKSLDVEDPFRKWMENRHKNRELDNYGYKNEKCRQCPKDNVCIGLIKEYADIHGTDELRWQR